MIPGIGGLGKMLVFLGVFLIFAGGLLILANKIPFLGKLPGDIYINRKNFTFYFPLATSIALSIIISFVMWIWSRK